MTTGIIHGYPQVKEGINYHFKRAIQAFKTENYREAFRQLGPLIHYIEDIGAPPHAIPIYGEYHGPMENWVKNNLIKIKDNYFPKQWGKTEEEAFANLIKEYENLRDFSKRIGENILPLVKENKKEEVEPIVLQSANKYAEVLADCLYTIFKLSENFERKKVIEGKITYPVVKFHEKKGARIILIDNSKYEALKGVVDEPILLYESTTEYTTFTDEKGDFEFYDIPEGEYRILSYRIGCKMVISEPFKVERGKTVKISLSLSPTEPENNLVLNPDFKLFYCMKNVPDYWEKKENVYIFHPIKLNQIQYLNLV